MATAPLHVLTVALSAAVVAGSAAGCSARPSPPGATGASAAPPPSSSPSAPTTSAPRTAKWIDLQPGDCLTSLAPTDPAVVSVTVVDCSAPHLSEAFLRAATPVNAAVDGTADTECEAGFLAYTGRPSSGSGYAIAYLIDSEQDRTDNNPYPSTVICLLQEAQGQSLTGSARRDGPTG